ncbi:PAS domain-containing protein [Zavarzinia sp. CC-PAN008]|uniref:PAS domain-containing protein n=1 Tax=Zavarzinia sp. CC-PAN008 TaxID=3243332 RepID=UPI003F747FD9
MDTSFILPSDAHPILGRLFAYWALKRGLRAMPSRADIDPVEIPYALGYICLADVIAGPPRRFRFRLDGTVQTRFFGFDMTGWYLDEFPDPEYRETALATFGEACDRAAPMYRDRNMERDGRTWRYQALYLPLGADGRTVDMLMVTIIPG